MGRRELLKMEGDEEGIVGKRVGESRKTSSYDKLLNSYVTRRTKARNRTKSRNRTKARTKARALVN